MPPVDIVSPLAFSRDTDKFWQEKMFRRNWASETGENFSLSELGGKGVGARGVATLHVPHILYSSHVHTHAAHVQKSGGIWVSFFSLSSKSV